MNTVANTIYRRRKRELSEKDGDGPITLQRLEGVHYMGGGGGGGGGNEFFLQFKRRGGGGDNEPQFVEIEVVAELFAYWLSMYRPDEVARNEMYDAPDMEVVTENDLFMRGLFDVFRNFLEMSGRNVRMTFITAATGDDYLFTIRQFGVDNSIYMMFNPVDDETKRALVDGDYDFAKYFYIFVIIDYDNV